MEENRQAKTERKKERKKDKKKENLQNEQRIKIYTTSLVPVYNFH